MGRGPGGFEYDRLEDYTELGQLVNDLCIGCPTEILKWETRNEILDTRWVIEMSDLVSPNDYLEVLD